MTMLDFEKAMRVAELAIKFGEVDRATQHPDGRPESDATHTVMLALLALEAGPPGLDLGELVINAVVHDLVEFDALDTCTARGLSKREREAKEQREAVALAKIKEMGLERLWSRIVRYERQASDEARWIRYVDKICPKLTHLMNRGRALRAIGMTAAEMEQKHAEQGAELAERYPEQEHARALFEAACRACEEQLPAELARSAAPPMDAGELARHIVGEALGIHSDCDPPLQWSELKRCLWAISDLLRSEHWGWRGDGPARRFAAPEPNVPRKLSAASVVNINQRVDVELTEQGLSMWRQYLIDLHGEQEGERLFGEWPKNRSWQLWELMQVFGPHIFNGMGVVPFVRNEVTIHPM